MDITPLFAPNALVINGYGDDYFLLNGKKISGDIYIYQNLYYAWQSSIALEDLVNSLVKPPEIVLIGQGRGCFKPSRDIILAMVEKNIAVDFMDTPSACRTYNILLAEGREVCAILKI